MAKYPVESGDNDGIQDAINYALSGPQSQGPLFAGFQDSYNSFLTGNRRLPFSNSNYARLYVAPITLSTSEWLDDYTWKFTFATPEAQPPFAVGNNPDVYGVTPGDYNGFYSGAGVVECSTTYVIVRTRNPYPRPATNGTGGSIVYNAADPNYGGLNMSTDANAKVVVNYDSSQVLLNAQLNNKITYQTEGTAGLEYRVSIARYRAFRNNDPTNPDFFFEYDKEVAFETYFLTLPDTTTAATSFTVSGVKPTATYPLTSVAPVLTYPYSYYIPNPASATGTGQGVNVTITIKADANTAYDATNTTVIIDDGGEYYAIGDTIIIDGADIGGVSGVNDMTLTVASTGGIAGFQGELNYETFLNGVIDNPGTGFYWYILEVTYTAISGGGTVYITQNDMGYRSLTAKVIKQ
jgi:hypothetical protein